MRHVLLELSFVGTAYHGWQVQDNAVSVQRTVQDAIERITGVRAGLTGCSRTDAGVHARRFFCAFFTESAIPAAQLPRALTAVLPFDVAVRRAWEVPASFHPRYSVAQKEYAYLIHNAPQRDPFLHERAWEYRPPLDAERMQAQGQAFLGKQDFAAFCAAGSSVRDTVRTVTNLTVERRGDLVELRVRADGFLYNMVRIIVGTLVSFGAGETRLAPVEEILASRDRRRSGPTAPACGLYLDRVWYAPEWETAGVPVQRPEENERTAEGETDRR